MAAKLLALMLSFLSLSQTAFDAYIAHTNLGGHLFLVNREYRVDKTYVPNDLTHPNVYCVYDDLTLRKDAAKALEELFSAAKDEMGFDLEAVSGYRSFGTQTAIFQRKIGKVGTEAKAQKRVAPPGTSEHQLGLAVDIGRRGIASLNERFGETAEGVWVAQNAHRFGFIIRYKKEWTRVTGYAYEPWHLRFVGREHAEEIFRRDIPLEYYVDEMKNAYFSEYLSRGEGEN